MRYNMGYDKKQIPERIIQQVRNYAMCIVGTAPDFYHFAINMVDYIGVEYVSCCKDLYLELSQVIFTQSQHMDNPDVITNIADWEILDWYERFKKEQKEKDEHPDESEIKENIDELQHLVKEFRDSSRFQEMLDYVGRARHIAPYNAMLIQMQMPGSKFAFTGKGWREYDRMPKPNAHPLIVLKPFGPVQCMFDYSDTEPIPGAEDYSEDDLMAMWETGIKKMNGVIDKKKYERLVNHLNSYGIYLDDNMLASNTYGGYIMPYKHAITAPINKKSVLYGLSEFMISVNHRQSETQKFHTICHELGHLFCRHHFYTPKKVRQNITLKQMEFEAETVAWLMCKRHGVDNPSEEYLATFAPEGEIPYCSSDYIMKAVTEIEDMISRDVVYVKGSMWYTENKELKDIIDDAIKKEKRIVQIKEKSL